MQKRKLWARNCHPRPQIHVAILALTIDWYVGHQVVHFGTSRPPPVMHRKITRYSMINTVIRQALDFKWYNVRPSRLHWQCRAQQPSAPTEKYGCVEVSRTPTMCCTLGEARTMTKHQIGPIFCSNPLSTWASLMFSACMLAMLGPATVS